MASQTVPAPAAASDPAPSAESIIRRAHRVGLFAPEHRRQIRELAETSSALEDLAETFPALLFALATGFGGVARRRNSRELVEAGAPLRLAAEQLGLAPWLRKLPAYAFVAPLPQFPVDAEFGLHVVNLVPPEPVQIAAWLDALSLAQISGGRSYALWMARHGHQLVQAMPQQRRLMMAAWVWFSQHPLTLGASLLRKPWSADYGLKRTLEEFTAWSQRAQLTEWLGSGALVPWIPDAMVGDLGFCTLRTAADFVAAATALDNCLEQYGDRLRSGTCTIATISRGDKIVACVEVGAHQHEATMPAIVQLRAARNRRAPPEVWQAAYAWIGHDAIEPLSPERLMPPRKDRAATRSKLWEPFLTAMAATATGQPMATQLRRALLRGLPLDTRAQLGGAGEILRRHLTGRLQRSTTACAARAGGAADPARGR